MSANLCIKYNIHNKDEQKLEKYAERSFRKGLSEMEEYLINCFFDKKDIILDIGTGCGRVAFGAYTIGFVNIYAIDTNLKLIKRAKQISTLRNCNINFLWQNTEYTTFNNNSFSSVIFSSDRFSKLPGNERKLEVLKEIYRIMEPDGVLILSAIDEGLVRENNFLYFLLLDNYRKHEKDMSISYGDHMHFASIKETTELIKKSGFKLLIHVTAKDILGENDKRSSNLSRFFILEK
jgi:ubiquinone/menaquinone biosynthesis C-methylase UbiE